MADESSSMMGAMSRDGGRGEVSCGARGDIFPNSKGSQQGQQTALGMKGGLLGGGYAGCLNTHGETGASGVGDGYGIGGTGSARGNALASRRHVMMPINPPQFNGGSDNYAGWRQVFLLGVRTADLGDVFLGQGALPRCTKTEATLLQEGFSGLKINTTLHAWHFLSAAMVTDSDKAIVQRCEDPRDALKHLDSVYKHEARACGRGNGDEEERNWWLSSGNPCSGETPGFLWFLSLALLWVQ